MKRIFAILVCLAASILDLRAEATPEEMISVYFEAFKKGDMETLAENMHEGELAKFQQALLPVIEQGIANDPMRVSRDAAAIRQLLGKDDVAALREETPQAFFIRFMTWMTRLNPMMIKTLAGATIQPLGFVAENDMAHVIYRINLEMMGAQVAQLKVMSVKKQGDAWRLMMTGEIEGLGKLFQANPKL